MPKSFLASARDLGLALGLVVALVACGNSGATGDHPAVPEDRDDTPLVATTFTILADITEQIGGDRVRVESITRPGADIHGYEPTSGDLRRVAGADLIVASGLGLDDWFTRFLDNTGAAHVEAARGIDPVDIRSGNYTGRPNPHAWMSPVEGRRFVETITGALTSLDPEGAPEFESNAAALDAELDALHSDLVAAVETIPESRRVLVTCEGAFTYLARDAGLDELYLWPVNTEAQGLPRQVSALIDDVRDREVPAVFCESTVPSAAMEQVAEVTGAEFAGTLYVDSLSESDGPVPTYLDLLRYDIDLITEGLREDAP